MTVTAPPTPKAWTLSELLGVGGQDEATTANRVADLASAAIGQPVPPQLADVVPVAYPFGSPATGALLRVQGHDATGHPWSLFVKVLQHVRHWVLYPLLPPESAERFAAEFPWREELTTFEPTFTGLLPDGMRPPVLHRMVDLGDDRLVIWMEDVRESELPWDARRYERAAQLLGRLTARRAAPEVVATSPYPAGYALGVWAEQGVRLGGLPYLDDDAVWGHPWLRAHADLRLDLHTLGGAIPAVLDCLNALPQAMPHGDASPQNLLVPITEPDTFVVIDVAFQTPHAVGFDLSQLVAGLVHAGLQPAAELPDIHAVVLDAFVAGLADEGYPADREQVELGYVGSLLLRSGFTSLPYDTLSAPVDDEQLAAAFAERIALTRFTVAQAQRVLAGVGKVAAEPRGR